MFSKKLLALAVLGATSLVCVTANAVVVYNDNNGNKFEVGGRVHANLNSVKASEDDEVSIKGRARLRVKGDSKISDGIYATAFGEWQVSAETSDGDKFTTRYAYLGFKTDDYGTLLVGQQRSAMYQVIGRTDLFIDWGMKGSTFVDLASGGRQEGQVYYKYSKNGFTGSASYQSAGLDRVDNGFAVALGYTFDNTALPFAIDLAVDHYEIAEGKTDKTKYAGNDEDRSSYAAALSAGTVGDGLYLAGIYQLTDYDKAESKHGYELLAGYGMDNGLDFLVSYQNLSQDDDTLVSSVTAEVSYSFNDYLKTYVEAEVGVGDIDIDANGNKADDRSDDKISLGLMYNF